jgi:hypothetical protein
MPLMTLMAWVDFFEKRYRRAMKKDTHPRPLPVGRGDKSDLKYPNTPMI